jgi:hypothetical protein
MLQIPRIPSVKPPFTFGDTAMYQAKQDLGKEIVECLRWMQKNTIVPAYQDMLGKFIAAVPCTSNIRDFTRLPYAASGPLDLRGNSELGCVYTRLSWLIQMYWDMCIDSNNRSLAIRAHLEWVRAVWSKGVHKCKIIGSSREGWTLEVLE